MSDGDFQVIPRPEEVDVVNARKSATDTVWNVLFQFSNMYPNDAEFGQFMRQLISTRVSNKTHNGGDSTTN